MNPTESDRNNPSDAAARRVESLAQAGGTSRAERWLRSLVQNSSDIIAIYEDDGTVRYMSSSVERILGYKPEELVGTSAFNHVHPEDVESASRSLYEALENGGVMPPVELRIQAADGSWRHLEMLLNNLLDDPDVGGIVANSRDITGRKEAYERLADSERRFSTVVSNAHAYIYRCRNEPGLPHEFASDYAVELTGYPPEDLLVGGKVRFGDLIVEEDRDKVWWEIHKALPQRRAFQVRYAIRRRDGEVRYLEDHGQGVYDEDGEVVALEGLIYDVTGLVRAEARLRESEERYRTLVEQIPAVTYIDRADGSDEPLYTSPQIEEMLGYTPEEWLEGRLWPERLHPDDRERVLDADERFESGDEPFSEEYRLLAKDGRVVWVREEAVLVRNEESEPLFWQGVIFDITERKEAEEAIERLAHRNQLILNSAGEGIYGLDREGRTTFVNPAAAALTGYEPDELVGEHQHDIVHHSRPDGTAYPKEECPIYSVLRDGEVQRVDDEVFWRKDGTSFPVEYTSTPIQEDGEVVGAVVTFTDVTERKRAEEALKESEERYRALMEQSVEAIYLYDAETKRVLESNAAFRRMMGYSEDELLGMQIYDFIDHDKENIDANIRRSLKEKRRYIGERRYRCKDGSVIVVDTSASVISYDGRTALCAVVRDITERKEAEEAVRRSKASLAESQRISHLGTWEWDVVTGEVLWSDETFRIYGFEPNAFVPTFEKLVEVVHPDDLSLLKAAIDDAFAGIRPYNFEHRIVRPSGGVRWVHRQAEVVRGEGGEPLRMIGTVHDITERKALEERLEYQAYHDSLTDMPNRHLFVDRLGQALRRTRRKKGHQVAVLFMDLDDFKAINDSLGHEMGDLLLVVVAERLRRCLRPEDTLARFGGDEFVVLIEDVEDPQGAVRLAERIVESFRQPFVVAERELFLRASIGIALGAARTKSAEDLLRDADTAMYEAKEEGLRYRIFDPAMYERAVGRLEMENKLRRAIEADQFVVHYQPIASLQTGEVRGVEALVRWNHPERGLLDPWEFMAVAEQSGIVVPMGEEVLQEACRQAKEWQEEHPRIPPLVMSVNLSAKQLQRPDIAQIVERVLKKTGLEARYLRLDITETVYIQVLEGNTQALDELTRMGVYISIDDFGMGYSSLAYLKRLPANALKVDKSFVKRLGEDVEDTAIVRMVIELAHTLGMEAIAEGVETWAQAALLEEMGCDLAQGFHFSEPLPPEAATNFLAEERTS
jgi:diguanylate cyclase (GGDEF)-like protein/PAS domain S-box-containing protein